MNAIRIEGYGGPEVLRLADVPAASPGPGQIVVRVEAAGVNFIDVYHRTGLYPNALPLVPGMEGAGVVAAVGPGVSGSLARATASRGRTCSAPTPSRSWRSRRTASWPSRRASPAGRPRPSCCRA